MEREANDGGLSPICQRRSSLKDCGRVSQKVTGGNELERQKSSGGFSLVFIIVNDNGNRVSPQGMALEMLEPCALKGVSTVPGRLGKGDRPGHPTL